MRINRQTNPFCTTFHEKRNTITLRNKLLSRACILQSCVLLAAMLFICNVEMNELDNFYYLATLIECTLTKHDICSIFPLIIYFFDTLQRSIIIIPIIYHSHKRSYNSFFSSPASSPSTFLFARKLKKILYPI